VRAPAGEEEEEEEECCDERPETLAACRLRSPASSASSEPRERERERERESLLECLEAGRNTLTQQDTPVSTVTCPRNRSEVRTTGQTSESETEDWRTNAMTRDAL